MQAFVNLLHLLCKVIFRHLQIVNASRSRRGQTGVHDQHEVARLNLGIRAAFYYIVRYCIVMYCNVMNCNVL